MSNSAHAPARLSTYIATHEAFTQSLRRGPVVRHDTLEFKTWPETITLKGEIACVGNIIIQVNKMLEIVEPGADPMVQTLVYSYDAWVRGHGNFLRYDNTHPHPGHADAHHKHVMDWRTSKGKVYWVGEDKWPSLTAVAHEVEQWYWEHREELPEPEAIPKLGTWGPTQTDSGG